MITQTATLRLKHGNLTTTRDGTTQVRDDGCAIYSGTQTFGTSHSALVKQSADVAAGGIAQQGVVLACNVSDANNALIGVDDSSTFRAFAILSPGEFAILPVAAGRQLYCRSSAGTVVVEHTAVER